MSEMEYLIYDEGYYAYAEGYQRSDCPYDGGETKKAWLSGWNSACYEIGDLR